MLRQEHKPDSLGPTQHVQMHEPSADRCTQENPGGSWPSTLVELASSALSERPCLKK